jgi:glycosyltransferase involved in cell wall biosynthesis
VDNAFFTVRDANLPTTTIEPPASLNAAIKQMISFNLLERVRQIRERLQVKKMMGGRNRLVHTAMKFMIPPKVRPYIKKWKRHLRYCFQQSDIHKAEKELQGILKTNDRCKGVVVLPLLVDWNWMRQRPHHLIAEFAGADYLAFFCSPQSRTDRFRGFKQVEKRLYLCSYPEILSAVLERPIVFATHPGHLDDVRAFNHPRVIYDHLDDIRVHCTDNKINSLALKQHEELLRTAEIVCATAKRLHDRVLAVRPDAILCPNGVHYDHFALKRKPAVPADLAKIVARGKPIVGYYGALAKWFDYDLVKELARQRPNYEYVLIGPNYDNSLKNHCLTKTSNLHWLGEKRYEELPAYAHYFDVATIPFAINEITLSTSPVKLFEYMAAGKPIVTTDLPECRKYRSVLLGHDRSEFAAQLDAALQLNENAEYRKTLSEEAHANTWRSRFEQIDACLQRENAPGKRAA